MDLINRKKTQSDNPLITTHYIAVDKILKQRFLFVAPQMKGIQIKQTINADEWISIYANNAVSLNLRQFNLNQKFQNISQIIESPERNYIGWRDLVANILNSTYYRLDNINKLINYTTSATKGAGMLIPRCSWVDATNLTFEGALDIIKKSVALKLPQMNVCYFSIIDIKSTNGQVQVSNSSINLSIEDQIVKDIPLNECLRNVTHGVIPFKLNLHISKVGQFTYDGDYVQCLLDVQVDKFSKNKNLEISSFDCKVQDNLENRNVIYKLQATILIHKIQSKFETIIEGYRVSRTQDILKMKGDEMHGEIIAQLINNIDIKCLQEKCARFDIEIKQFDNYTLYLQYKDVKDHFSLCKKIDSCIQYPTTNLRQEFVGMNYQFKMRQDFKIYLSQTHLINGFLQKQGQAQSYKFVVQDKKMSEFIKIFKKDVEFILLDDNLQLKEVSESIFSPQKRTVVDYSFIKKNFKVSNFITLKDVSFNVMSQESQALLSPNKMKMSSQCHLLNYTFQVQSIVPEDYSSIQITRKSQPKSSPNKLPQSLFHPFFSKLQLTLKQIQSFQIMQNLKTGGINSKFIIIFSTGWELLPEIRLQAQNEHIQVYMKFSIFTQYFTSKLEGGRLQVKDIIFSAQQLFKNTIQVKSGLHLCNYRLCCNLLTLDNHKVTLKFQSTDSWQLINNKLQADDISIQLAMLPYRNSCIFHQKCFRVKIFSIPIFNGSVTMASQNLNFNVLKSEIFNFDELFSKILSIQSKMFGGLSGMAQIKTNIFENIIKPTQNNFMSKIKSLISPREQYIIQLIFIVQQMNFKNFLSIPLKLQDCSFKLKLNLSAELGFNMVSGSQILIKNVRIQRPLTINFQAAVQFTNKSLKLTTKHQKGRINLPGILSKLDYQKIAMQIEILSLTNPSYKFQFYIQVNKEIFNGIIIEKMTMDKDYKLHIHANIFKQKYILSLPQVNSCKAFIEKDNKKNLDLWSFEKQFPVGFERLNGGFDLMIQRQAALPKFTFQYKQNEAYFLLSKQPSVFEIRSEGVKIVPKLIKDILKICFIRLTMMKFHMRKQRSIWIKGELGIQLQNNPYIKFFLGQLPKSEGKFEIIGDEEQSVSLKMPPFNLNIFSPVTLKGSYQLIFKQGKLQRQQIIYEYSDSFKLIVSYKDKEFRLSIQYQGVIWGAIFKSILSCQAKSQISKSSIDIDAKISMKFACGFKAQAQADFTLQNTICPSIKLNYAYFSLTDISLGQILASIFSIDNRYLLKMLNFLPKINYATFIMGGKIEGMSIQPIHLQRSVYKSYDGKMVNEIPALYRYFDCDIQILGVRAKMKLGFSLQSFQFGLKLSKISLLGGLIEVSGASRDEIVLQGNLGLKFSDSKAIEAQTDPRKLKSLLGHFDVELSLDVSIKISILKIFSVSARLKISDGDLFAQIYFELFGIQLYAHLIINSDQLKVSAGVKSVFSQGQQEKRIREKQAQAQSRQGFWDKICSIFKKILSFFIYIKINMLGVTLGYNRRTGTLMAEVHVEIYLKVLSVYNKNYKFDWSIQIKSGLSLILEIIERLWKFICGGYQKKSKQIKQCLKKNSIPQQEFQRYNQQEIQDFLEKNNIKQISDEQANQLKDQLFEDPPPIQKVQKRQIQHINIHDEEFEKEIDLLFNAKQQIKVNEGSDPPKQQQKSTTNNLQETKSDKINEAQPKEASLVKSVSSLQSEINSEDNQSCKADPKPESPPPPKIQLQQLMKKDIKHAIEQIKQIDRPSPGKIIKTNEAINQPKQQQKPKNGTKAMLETKPEKTIAVQSKVTTQIKAEITPKIEIKSKTEQICKTDTDSGNKVSTTQPQQIRTKDIQNNNQSRNTLVQYSHDASLNNGRQAQKQPNRKYIFTCYCRQLTKTDVDGPFSCNNYITLKCGHKEVCNPLPCKQNISIQIFCKCGRYKSKIIVKCAEKQNPRSTFECEHQCQSQCQRCSRKCSKICMHACQCSRLTHDICEDCPKRHYIVYFCGKRSGKCNGINTGTAKHTKMQNHDKSYLKNRQVQEIKNDSLKKIKSITDFDLSLQAENIFKKCQLYFKDMFNESLNPQNHEKYSIIRLIVDFDGEPLDITQIQKIVFALYLELYYPISVEVIVTGPRQKMKPFFLKQTSETFCFRILLQVIKCLLQLSVVTGQLSLCQQEQNSISVDYVVIFTKKLRKIQTARIKMTDLRKIFVFHKDQQGVAVFNQKQNKYQESILNPMIVFKEILNSGNRNIPQSSLFYKEFNKSFWQSASFLRLQKGSQYSKVIKCKIMRDKSQIHQSNQIQAKKVAYTLDEKKKLLSIQKQKIQDGKVIQQMIDQCRGLTADIATKYQLSTKGIIELEGILKFFTSGGTCDTIYSQKKGGRKQRKPTIIIVDLSLSSKAHILTCFFPVLYHLCKFMESKKFPFCIKVVLGEIGIVRYLDHKQLSQHNIHIMTEKLEQSTCNSSQCVLILQQAIQLSANQLNRQGRQVQKVIIVLSNSLHKLNGPKMRRIIESSVSISLKINFLTFNAYQSLEFPNSIFLASYRSLKPIIKSLYQNENYLEECGSSFGIERLNFEQILKLINTISSVPFIKINEVNNVGGDMNQESLFQVYLSQFFDYVSQSSSAKPPQGQKIEQSLEVQQDNQVIMLKFKLILDTLRQICPVGDYSICWPFCEKLIKNERSMLFAKLQILSYLLASKEPHQTNLICIARVFAKYM